MIKLELKEGFYIRTKKGIGKINEIRDFMGVLEFHLDSNIGKIHNVTNNTYWNNVDDIIGEPSEHLIDLIEIGDYVNAEKVTFVYSPTGLNNYSFTLGDHIYNCTNDDIRDVVTKEQFEACKYVVEGDNCEK